MVFAPTKIPFPEKKIEGVNNDVFVEIGQRTKNNVSRKLKTEKKTKRNSVELSQLWFTFDKSTSKVRFFNGFTSAVYIYCLNFLKFKVVQLNL